MTEQHHGEARNPGQVGEEFGLADERHAGFENGGLVDRGCNEASEFAAQATPSAFSQRGDGFQGGPGISRWQVFREFALGDRQRINP